MPKTTHRFDTLAAARVRQLPAVDGLNGDGETLPIEDIFGESTFGLEEMRTRLPKQIFRGMIATINEGTPLDPAIADAVALAMKEWAVEKGGDALYPLVPAADRLHGGKARLFHHAQSGWRCDGGVQRQGSDPRRA